MREAIILAGGFGTRLRQVVSEVPKPMAPVNGRPFLEYVFDYLKKYGIEHAVLSVGFMADPIRQHFGAEFNGISVGYALEHEPLGTGGAIKLAMDVCTSDHVLVLNGDTLFDVNLTAFERFHKENEAEVSIALRHLSHVDRYGTVKVNEEQRITGFAEKSAVTGEGYINGGIYLIDRRMFKELIFPDKFSVEKDFFELYYERLRMFGFASDSYFIDIGIPEDYQRAQNELKHYEF
jgi:D-glycero-alpha-D-manno-heptose 1-phosphate guanylyltransferase